MVGYFCLWYFCSSFIWYTSSRDNYYFFVTSISKNICFRCDFHLGYIPLLILSMRSNTIIFFADLSCIIISGCWHGRIAILMMQKQELNWKILCLMDPSILTVGWFLLWILMMPNIKIVLLIQSRCRWQIWNVIVIHLGKGMQAEPLVILTPIFLLPSLGCSTSHLTSQDSREVILVFRYI